MDFINSTKILDNSAAPMQNNYFSSATDCTGLHQRQTQPSINQNNLTQSSGNSNKMASGYHGVNAPPVLPIDDFHMIENPNKYSEEEKQLRIKLTAVYRLIEMNGWSMGIYNHVTAKLEKQTERILIHPFGLHYNEITASSLLKIDMSGNIVDQGTTNFELNRPGYIVHSAIHMARPDLKAIIHLHYPPVASASTCKYGLLPVCQEQALLGEIAYLDYNGILTQEDERDAVAAGLGKKSKVMILRNHGLICCGETIEEAFYLLTNLMRACETQARLLTFGGLENLVLMSEDASYQAWDMVQKARYPIKQNPNNNSICPTTQALVLENLKIRSPVGSDDSTTSGNESDFDQSLSDDSLLEQTIHQQNHHHHQQQQQQQQQQPQQLATTKKNNCKKNIIGYVNMFELDFEAQMRALDLLGHETGYKYKRPLVRHYKR